MLIAKPKQIKYLEMARLALKSRGKIEKLYLHWSAGKYHQFFDDYHINIDSTGEIYLTCQSFEDYKNHTWQRNYRTVGIALCCAYRAQAYGADNIDFGTMPPTIKQVETMARVVSVLTLCFGLEINSATVLTHCEAAVQDGYGPQSKESDLGWDLWFLKDYPLTDNLKPGGQILRQKALWYNKNL